MAEKRYITNLKGILYYIDTALLDFEIRDRELIKSVNLSGGRFFPPELATWGISYGNNNLDNYWIKFDSFGASNYTEMITQDLPAWNEES